MSNWCPGCGEALGPEEKGYCTSACRDAHERKRLTEIAILEAGLNEAVDLIADLVGQSCYDHSAEGGDTYDSCAISAYADAMTFLAERGRFVIEHESGRRVIGKFKKEGT